MNPQQVIYRWFACLYFGFFLNLMRQKSSDIGGRNNICNSYVESCLGMGSNETHGWKDGTINWIVTLNHAHSISKEIEGGYKYVF